MLRVGLVAVTSKYLCECFGRGLGDGHEDRGVLMKVMSAGDVVVWDVLHFRRLLLHAGNNCYVRKVVDTAGPLDACHAMPS